jgi:hypothetical protein
VRKKVKLRQQARKWKAHVVEREEESKTNHREGPQKEQKQLQQKSEEELAKTRGKEEPARVLMSFQRLETGDDNSNAYHG